jgi:hypothetical protein
MSSLHSKVSKSYKDTKISDIVSDIYYDYLHGHDALFYAVPTDRIENIIIPNLSPTNAINWLSKRAIPESGNGVNYLFYQTVSGSFFTSIDMLAQEEPFFKYILQPRIDDPTGVENISIGTFKIKKLTFMNQFDKVKNIRRGIYSSKLLTHDIVTKRITQYDYNGFDGFMGLSHFGTFPPLVNSDMETRSSRKNRTNFAPGDPENNYLITNESTLSDMTDSRVEFYPKHNQMYARNAGELYNNKVEDWKLQRNNNYGIYDGITIMLEVSGNSALKVGQAITLIIPSPETTDRDGMSDRIDDKFLSGTYMVTAIQHVFSQYKTNSPKMSYDMKIEVVKDGLEDMVATRESRRED